MTPYVQEAQQTPSMINSKKFILRHIIIKLSKDKDRILKAVREKKLIMCNDWNGAWCRENAQQILAIIFLKIGDFTA